MHWIAKNSKVTYLTLKKLRNKAKAEQIRQVSAESFTLELTALKPEYVSWVAMNVSPSDVLSTNRGLINLLFPHIYASCIYMASNKYTDA